MDAKERLRRYLEQRREMGENDLVLDGMTVEDVMRIVGARAGASAPVERPVERAVADDARATRTSSASEPAVESADWREILRASGSAPSAPISQPREPRPEARGRADAPVADEPPPAVVSEPSPDALPIAEPARRAAAATAPVGEPPAGIIVGQPMHELFGGPLSHLATLDDVARTIAQCTRCPLYSTALNPVPGEGNPNADFVCVGEAPGQTEDETGRPFVGAAGQLLTKILAAINLRREDVFICNVLKHRPPGNRNPLPTEVTACSPYVVRQLELIRPKVILALGTFAAQTLLDTKLSIGKLRGSVHKYYGIPLVVTYHPAALLRNPTWKRPTWEDVQLARRILDRPAGA